VMTLHQEVEQKGDELAEVDWSIQLCVIGIACSLLGSEEDIF
jgi:hypothetical protein